MRPELAYLLGAYLSDGYLNWQGRDPLATWQVKDEPFADCISIALAKVGSPHSCYRRSYWRVAELSGGKLGKWLHRVSPEKEYLPQVPKDLVRPLVAGLMDGDGGVSGGYVLSYTGGKGFVLGFRTLLEDLGVKQGKFRRAAQSPVRGWSINIKSFLAAGLCFAMPRKQERLAQWCSRAIGGPYSGQYPRKIAVAKWWTKNVYAREWPNAIPLGYNTFEEEANDLLEV